jgi:putative tryptophan/tyrosine transport system substrate-binding protein
LTVSGTEAGSRVPSMRRREFISLLGGAAAAWPFAARAQQQAGKLPTIGFLGADASNWSLWTAAFAARLRELGWTEGHTIAIEYRWSEGRAQNAAQIAAEFVRLRATVIVTNYSGAFAAKQATSVIPIVFVLGSDPVASGLVAGLARPGGNVTGLSVQAAEVAGKRLELLRETVPRLRWLAVMVHADFPDAALEIGHVQTAAHALGFDVVPLQIRRATDIASAFESLNPQADALYVVQDAVVIANRTAILAFALTRRLPTIFSGRDFVQAGGLMSYGPNFPGVFRRAADYVDKIMRGAKPSDIPIEQPTKFDLVINLMVARALGLTIPEKLLAIADEVIE